MCGLFVVCVCYVRFVCGLCVCVLCMRVVCVVYVWCLHICCRYSMYMLCVVTVLYVLCMQFMCGRVVLCISGGLCVCMCIRVVCVLGVQYL